ncbi:MAG: hypothetical protein JSR59_19920 [Proteobacteria bacterium]|nr:hypothetical protein [Pseudomonadota bacterium]
MRALSPVRHPQPPKDPFWQALLLKAVPALILLVATYAVTGRVEQALKERQMTVAGIEAMSKLIDGLPKGDQDADADAAQRLAMYGVDAIGPLIILGLYRRVTEESAAKALASIAIAHKLEVCDQLLGASKLGWKFPKAETQAKYLFHQLPKDLGCRDE